ncbi:hypothetical protein AGDE_01277 [Angomonas deanei]|uniref:RING-type domain-containing protein n=1 Tax=Angomonas deanei TaxID=59799 RepID=S9WNC7_9TRYP|nr:hypothetical protein AGDE_06449 [Angomonas deanei]EPY42646.1 hypothetical protein AGDE_01277 [Angomonas deanei]CAD2218334.1 hypothetical protein, conserved [Angomonas deanei]|eukprot:EPY37485.1 hypothetical protein AGDE_06449 [Angomonas deanei]
MSKYFKPDNTVGVEAECAVCCCLWTDPVEVKDCEHIFCRNCVNGLTSCPQCRQEIVSLVTPNLAIIRMLKRMRGSCSVCAWKGTYNDFQTKHKRCLGDGETQEEELESGIGKSTTEDSSMYPGVNSVSNVINVDIGQTLTNDQKQAWKGSSPLDYSEFGLSKSEFESLRTQFPDFATARSNGEPELRWRDTVRFLRFNNLPSMTDDVQSLFEMAHQSPSSGSIPFRVLCLWVSLNRRSSVQWYSIPTQFYSSLLSFAQLIDTEKTGLFTNEQAKLIAEQYFERDVPASEWSRLQASFQNETLLREGESHGEYVTFHQLLLCFNRYVEENSSKRDIVERIRKVLTVYEPAALEHLNVILGNFKGEEESLLQTMISQYGPEPS